VGRLAAVPGAVTMRPDRSKDRPALKNLLAALDAQTRVLQRDNCGDWQIRGKHGEELEDIPSCIYAVPEEGAFYPAVPRRTRSEGRLEAPLCITKAGRPHGSRRQGMSRFPHLFSQAM
jgi:hypothetical protein